MNKILPDEMVEAIEKVDLDEVTKQLVTDVLYAERVRKEQDWNGDAVKMLEKYLTAEQEKSNGVNL